MRLLLAKALLFPALLGALLLALKTQDRHADIGPYWRKLQDVRRLAPETVLLGSSRTYRHVDPVALDSLRADGATTYNFGLPGSRALETHYRADRLLAMGLPGLERLVVELAPFDVAPAEASRETRRVQHAHDWRRARIGAETALAAELPLRRRLVAAADRYRLWTRNTFLVGWGRALAASLAAERAAPDPYTVGRRGFVGLGEISDEALRARRAEFLSPRGRAEFEARTRATRSRGAAVPTRRDSVGARAWARLAERGARRGVEVVFVEQVGTENGAALARLVAGELGADRVLVLNDAARYPDLFEYEAWFDVAHLQGRIAERVTGILAERLPPRPSAASERRGAAELPGGG